MKKLDVYILKKFLSTFFFIISLLLVISIVIDLTEKIDNFIENSVPFGVILTDYFLNFIPYIGALLAPLFIFISVIFFTSQLAGRSELIAITASGTGFYRVMLPYVVGAGLLAAGLYYANNFLVPRANENRLAFENTYLRKYNLGTKRQVQRKIDENTYLYFDFYNVKDSTANRFSIETYENQEIAHSLSGEKLIWLPKEKKWKLQQFEEVWFEDEHETIKKEAEDIRAFPFEPANFYRKLSQMQEMTSPQLKQYIQDLRDSGIDSVIFYELELHRRTASAFSVVILTLIGYAVASRKTRGGMGIHLVIGIAIAGLFELTNKFSYTFSTNANLPAILGVWMPNILFLFFLIYIIKNTQK